MKNHRQWVLSLICALSLLPLYYVAQLIKANEQVLPRVVVLPTGGTIVDAASPRGQLWMEFNS